ncbi:RNA polymerase II transcription factor B subunit 4 [Actinomortierella ambigua]|uniref:General transcription and DNA repair factor IIH subunit TFB4 n=1 Tax=Actinomortierella ambigua TaxID=1343610 RepID=A0A9P6QCV4_9FUNG|nr:RNA polymerase II transcription factor B subunit 4 [Actinomortierella ambigua]
MNTKQSAEDDSNLLVLVIDTNPFEWQHPSAPLKLNNALQHMLIFMNAHLAGRHDNKLAVIASHVGVSKFVYPSDHHEPGVRTQVKKDANVYQTFKVADDAVLEGIDELLRDFEPTLAEKNPGSSKIAASLSLGLCYINQVVKADGMGRIKPRILVLTVSPDAPSDYIPSMNCIFSAQKANIPIDVCKIWGEDAVFLQQASHITGGIYIRLDDPHGLLQFLMFSFLPDVYSRDYLYLPGQDQVDFRAACFCHKKIVDIGYVCSSFAASRLFVLHAADLHRERIIFAVDLDSSMEEFFHSADKQNEMRITRTKQLIKRFVEQKASWNDQHEFALMILGQKAVWHVDFTRDVSLFKMAIDELYAMGTYSSFDSTSLFEEVYGIKRDSDYISGGGEAEVVEELHMEGKFYFDCIYIHNRSSEVAGDIKPQKIYDRLTEMENPQQPGYFFEMTRLFRKYSLAMTQLLANPLQRMAQDDNIDFDYVLPKPPSLRQQEEEELKRRQQRQRQRQLEQQQQQQQQLQLQLQEDEIQILNEAPKIMRTNSSPSTGQPSSAVSSPVVAAGTATTTTSATTTRGASPSSNTTSSSATPSTTTTTTTASLTVGVAQDRGRSSSPALGIQTMASPSRAGSQQPIVIPDNGPMSPKPGPVTH